MLYTCVTEIICVDSHECNLYNKLRCDQELVPGGIADSLEQESGWAFEIMGFIDDIFKNHGVCLGLKVSLNGLGNALSEIVDVTTV